MRRQRPDASTEDWTTRQTLLKSQKLKIPDARTRSVFRRRALANRSAWTFCRQELEDAKRLEESSPESRDITPTPEGTSIANSIESHDSGVDEVETDNLRRTPLRGSSILDGKSLRSESGDSNHDSLGRSLQSSPNGSVGDLSRCSTPSSTGGGSCDKKNRSSKIPKSFIPVSASAKKASSSPSSLHNGGNFRGLKFERRVASRDNLNASHNQSSPRTNGMDEHKENSRTNGYSNSRMQSVQADLAELSCASEVIEESADVLDAKVRQHTCATPEIGRFSVRFLLH